MTISLVASFSLGDEVLAEGLDVNYLGISTQQQIFQLILKSNLSAIDLDPFLNSADVKNYIQSSLSLLLSADSLEVKTFSFAPIQQTGIYIVPTDDGENYAISLDSFLAASEYGAQPTFEITVKFKSDDDEFDEVFKDGFTFDLRLSLDFSEVYSLYNLPPNPDALLEGKPLIDWLTEGYLLPQTLAAEDFLKAYIDILDPEGVYSILRFESKAPEPPTFFAPRSIKIDPNQESVIVGIFTAFDADTSFDLLTFKFLDEAGSEVELANDFHIEKGSAFWQLVYRGDPKLLSPNSIQFLNQATDLQVRDDQNNLTFSKFDFNSYSKRFEEALTFEKPAPQGGYTESIYLPSIGGDGSVGSLEFSASGLSGNISLDSVRLLTDKELDLVVSSLGVETPLTPLLEFTLKLDEGMKYVRFEFALPEALWSDWEQIEYIKFYKTGPESFSYSLDELGTPFGARVEFWDGNDFDGYDGRNLGSVPLYLALYIRDNGPEDFDDSLGFVRDPGFATRVKRAAVPSVPDVADPPVPDGGSISNPPGPLPGRDLPAPVSRPNPLLSPRVPTAADTILSDQGSVFNIRSSRAFGNGVFFGGRGADVIRLRGKFRNRSVYIDAGDGDDIIRTGSGSDTILGGDGNDVIIASNRKASKRRRRGRGQPEVDRISGGAGNDLFVLGIKKQSFYLDLKGRGSDSYALITDFGDGDRIQLSGRRRQSYSISRSFAPEGLEGNTGFSIFQDDDLIAYVVADPVAVASVDLDDGSRFAYAGRVRR